MLAAEAIRLTEEAVKELRARGQDERARALENVVSVAAAALGGTQRAPAYLTTAQVARMLGGGRALVRELVTRGDLQVERLGRRQLITRDALLAYFTKAKSERLPTSAQTPEGLAARKRLHQFVMAGLPADKVSRQEALHDKMEAGQTLTRAERAELAAIEQAILKASAERLERWIEQTESDKP
jgi:excisionase family DNA binding protein